MKDKAEARRLPVEGARNLRDIGGYRTVDGRTVRRGLVLRGGHPGDLTEAGRAGFAALGLRAIVDLRSNGERASHPFPEEIRPGAHYWSRDYEISGGDLVALLRDTAAAAEQMRQRMIQTYTRLPYEQAPGIAAALRLAADGGGPMLVNCTAGKDRTGVTCAVLLAALGVPQEHVIEDYALTEWLEDPDAGLFWVDPEGPHAYLLSVDPAVWRMLNRSDPDYIRTTYATLESAHGSIEGFISGELGISPDELERLREVMLEG